MIAFFIFLASLIFGFLALLGWPLETSAWTRGLIAVSSIVIGVAAILLGSPSATVRKDAKVAIADKGRLFISSRKPRRQDHLAAASCIAVVLMLFYFSVVFLPPVAHHVSVRVLAMAEQRLSMSDAEGERPTTEEQVDPARNQEGATHQTEVTHETGTMFDRNGAVIPKAANVASVDLPTISLEMPNRIAAQRLRDMGQIYLHHFSHHAFDGERWTSPNSNTEKLTADPDGLIHLRAPGQASDFEYTIFHHQLPREMHKGMDTGMEVLCTLQGADYVSLPEITRLNSGTWLLPIQRDSAARIRSYQAGSSPKRLRTLMASATPIEPAMPSPVYLSPSTDADLNRRIQDLAAGFKKRPELEHQLADLQRWLSGSFGYTTVLDYSDKEKSALESFLSNPGQSEGFCVHFASAAVLLLRELGVPSRISYGWTGAEYHSDHNQFVFRAENGHAWAEIFLKDHGWVVFEATPDAGLPQLDTAPAQPAPPVAKDDIDLEGDGLAKAQESQPSAVWDWVVVAAAVTFALCFVLLLIKRNKPGWLAHGSVDDGMSAPPDYIQLFHQACSKSGHPKPVGRTLLQHLKELERHKASLPFANELLRYHYQVTYHEAPRDLALERRLYREIKSLWTAKR